MSLRSSTVRSALRVYLGQFIFLIMIALFLGGRSLCAQDIPATEAILNSHLNAGEFGPARSLAQQQQEPALRNRWFGIISSAQVASGARRASVDTASYISDDRQRSSLLQKIGSKPIGSGRGGGVQADFDELINLITSTIAPDSWDEAGGPGTISEFASGVYVDSLGTLRKLSVSPGSSTLTSLRRIAARDSGNHQVRRNSSLRKVSLVRLEKQIQMRRALGQSPSEEMRALAGLRKVKFIFLYPESGDIVLAGPAGDWNIDHHGRRISVEENRPILNLDDFVVVLRNAYEHGGRFGCSIIPRTKNLARTKAFLAESNLKGLAWVRKLRETLGKQDIEVYGIDPRTRVARVMVEADYHMKLVGMGLEEGTLGVSSYFDAMPASIDDSTTSTDVIRWWFALNYKAIHSNEAHDAFHLQGQGVKVLSETELITERGERVHTGKSSGPTLEFAHSFTKQFKLLAAKYPIYAELQNLFDLAIVAALIHSEDMPGQVGWHMTHFGPPAENNSRRYQVELGTTAREVDSVVNHRFMRQRIGKTVRTRLVAGVSGGVSVRTEPLVQRNAIQIDLKNQMTGDRRGSAPKNLSRSAWWWD